MSIQEISSNFKHLLPNGDLALTLLISVVGICSFYLGRISVSPEITEKEIFPASAAVIDTREAIPRNEQEVSTTTKSDFIGAVTEGGYVASKNGTKYHLPWCSGAKRIKAENKVWFATKEEAEGAGYAPASNCKGI